MTVNNRLWMFMKGNQLPHIIVYKHSLLGISGLGYQNIHKSSRKSGQIPDTFLVYIYSPCMNDSLVRKNNLLM